MFTKLTVAALHGSESSVEPLETAFEKHKDRIILKNIVKTDIIGNVYPDGSVDKATLRRYAAAMFGIAESNPDIIISVCNICSEYVPLVSPFVEMPVLEIDKPMAKEVAAEGGKIGILASRPGCASACARHIRQAVDHEIELIIDEVTVTEAHDMLVKGDRAAHDRIIAKKARLLSDNGCRTIVLSQISLVGAAKLMIDVGAKVISSLEPLAKECAKILKLED